MASLAAVPALSSDVFDPGRGVAPGPGWDQPGELGIRERRSWATWQLAVFGVVTALAGMAIGYSGKKPATSANSGAGVISLDGPSSRAPSVAPQVTTPAAPEVTSTSTPPTTAAAPAASGPATVLSPNTTGAGPRDLPAFDAGASWSIGWHFRCTAAPNGTSAFTIDVVPEPAAAVAGGAHAVEQSGHEAQGVAPQATAGRFHLKVTTDPACRWAVKVTGAAP